MTATTQEPAAPATDETIVDDDARRGGAPTRAYVVLEEIQLDGADETVAFQKIAVVEARNGTNAKRKAFKEIRATREGYDEAVLVVVPEGQWKPTTVRAERKESITVTVGE